MRLFDMTESQLDAAVQAHYDQMYRDFYESGPDVDPCCGNCDHWGGPECRLLEERMTDEEAEQARETGDWSAIDRDEDDYCDDWTLKEDLED